VRNKAQPEGSIAEGYVVEKCMKFCAKYLVDMDSRLNRAVKYIEHASDDCNGLLVFKNNGRSIGPGKL